MADRAVRVIIEEVGGDRRRVGYTVPKRMEQEDWVLLLNTLTGAFTNIRDRQLLPPMQGATKRK